VSVRSGQVHEQFTKLRDYYNGSANSLFTKASGLLSSAVSLPGDEANLEIEFEIPIDPSGVGFIGGRLSIEAEKDDDSMIKTRTEMVVTGGVNIGVAKVKAELGGYIEAQGANAVDVMNLSSYGMYRRFRESSAIPREAANYMWGGQTSSYGYDKAEAWSRQIEQQLFGELPDPDPNDPKYASMSSSAKLKALDEDQKVVAAARERVKNTYVETGGIVAGKGEVGIAELVSLEIGVTYTAGKKITAESIKAAKGKAGGKNTGGLIRGAQKSLGEDTSSVSFSMAATVGPLEGEFEISKSGSDLEISFDVTGELPASALEGITAYLANVALSMQRFARTVNAAGEDEVLGPVAALGSTTAAIYSPVMGVVKDGDPTSMIGDVGLRLSMSAEREDGEWSGSIELRQVKSKSFEPPIGLKVELEKSERIGALEYSGGKWRSSSARTRTSRPTLIPCPHTPSATSSRSTSRTPTSSTSSSTPSVTTVAMLRAGRIASRSTCASPSRWAGTPTTAQSSSSRSSTARPMCAVRAPRAACSLASSSASKRASMTPSRTSTSPAATPRPWRSA